MANYMPKLSITFRPSVLKYSFCQNLFLKLSPKTLNTFLKNHQAFQLRVDPSTFSHIKYALCIKAHKDTTSSSYFRDYFEVLIEIKLFKASINSLFPQASQFEDLKKSINWFIFCCYPFNFLFSINPSSLTLPLEQHRAIGFFNIIHWLCWASVGIIKKDLLLFFS